LEFQGRRLLRLDNVLNVTKELCNNIVSSQCYLGYLSAKSNLINCPELYNKVKELKNLQVDLQNDLLQNIEITFDREKYLSKQYSDLLLNETIKTFLLSEKKFFAMLAKVYDSINENLDIENFNLYEMVKE
jgi:cell fate (sporulation/competence/biofilm development) regulator YlbF (YheA/YmcA/DUF963 family)